jgi:hypothetical protein
MALITADCPLNAALTAGKSVTSSWIVRSRPFQSPARNFGSFTGRTSASVTWLMEGFCRRS